MASLRKLRRFIVLMLLLLLLLLATMLVATLLTHQPFPSVRNDVIAKYSAKNDDDDDVMATTTAEIRLPREAMAHVQRAVDGSTTASDVYLCTAINSTGSSRGGHVTFATGFEPLLSLDTAVNSSMTFSRVHVHHMLLATCSQLPEQLLRQQQQEQLWWNCGSMAVTSTSTSTTTGREDSALDMCSYGLRYSYAYAMHAPPLRLPRGVAFPLLLGGSEHLVLQVHFTLAATPGTAASSSSSSSVPASPTVQQAAPESPSSPGVRLRLLSSSSEPHRRQPERLAGVHLSATGGLIGPRTVTHLTAGCPYTGSGGGGGSGESGPRLHPFAFRVHTHRLGRVVSVYRVRGGQWTLIGRANPQLPQMFHPVNASPELAPGDLVAAACVMDNRHSDRLVRVGPAATDEMCNAYVMYWTKANNWNRQRDRPVVLEAPEVFGCYSKGSSDVWWEAPPEVAREAATVPGTEVVLPPSQVGPPAGGGV